MSKTHNRNGQRQIKRILAWLGLIPLIKFFGDGLTSPIYPATTLIKDMSASQIWGSYIRYIGAGGVLAGGFITLFKTFPTLIKAFKDSLSGFGASAKGQKGLTAIYR
ncbi:OPT/YSL family transporter [Thermoanaerobacterium saccharolyticum]|uniref:OPT/YSL family transporter n=1 Tax=Thermoanaerobacterium saccharolyticum TaxID=28896 RepID=UPI0005F0B57F